MRRFHGICKRQTDKTATDSIRTACNGKTATVRCITRQEKSIAPPKLYDLTTLQREANRLFGYTAQQTLNYAQELYEQKLITYPRTDSRFLTGDMAADFPRWRPLSRSTSAFCRVRSTPRKLSTTARSATTMR